MVHVFNRSVANRRLYYYDTQPYNYIECYLVTPNMAKNVHSIFECLLVYCPLTISKYTRPGQALCGTYALVVGNQNQI